ncbi:unnamed protein product [Cyprideis torosa]|uniref:Uncharacterized protein n=1 Tax=Cyprideis torosa TaxID=163714 RepID=A0A7R8ZRN3_9CRUS|nr:unnamed protein product [Cyprideis torosa]CAG0905199.1 unnamed protein product [Cyprideis torosa]
MKPAEKVQFPVITICPHPFWKGGGGDEWMANFTSDSLTSPLQMLKFGPYFDILSLEVEIGSNFTGKRGKWSSNIFLDYNRESYSLCYTMNDRDQYQRDQHQHYLWFESDPGINMTWNIYLTTGTESLSSSIRDRSTMSSHFLSVTPGNKYEVDFNIEEFQLLTTHDAPCNSTIDYSYSECLDDCLKRLFVTGEIHRKINQTRCQIPGFEDVHGLEPCETIDQKKMILHRYAMAQQLGEQLDFCEEACPTSCTQLEYKFHTRLGKYGDANRAELEFRNPQKFRTVTTQQWSYGGLEMAADVGGYVGVLLGISFLSISQGIIQRLQPTTPEE